MILFDNVYPWFVMIRQQSAGEAAVIGDIPRVGSATFYEHITFTGDSFSAGR